MVHRQARAGGQLRPAHAATRDNRLGPGGADPLEDLAADCRRDLGAAGLQAERPAHAAARGVAQNELGAQQPLQHLLRHISPAGGPQVARGVIRQPLA